MCSSRSTVDALPPGSAIIHWTTHDARHTDGHTDRHRHDGTARDICRCGVRISGQPAAITRTRCGFTVDLRPFNVKFTVDANPPRDCLNYRTLSTGNDAEYQEGTVNRKRDVDLQLY